MSIVDLTLSNLKLFKGAHGFPDDSGDGLCVNEAATIFAGYEFRSVATAYDCPRCFSRVIATYALWFNDNMPHALRNRLLKPFVERIPGTAAAAAIEKQRSEFIVLETGRRVMSALCSGYLKSDLLAQQCAEVSHLDQFEPVFAQVNLTYPIADPCFSLLRAIKYANSPRRKRYAIDAPTWAAYAITEAARLYNPTKLWTLGVQILGLAIDIGGSLRFATQRPPIKEKLREAA